MLTLGFSQNLYRKGIMAEHDACDLTAKYYCKDKNITPSMFYYWRKKLADSPRISLGFVAVSITAKTFVILSR